MCIYLIIAYAEQVLNRKEHINPWLAKFHELDSDGSGRLDATDIANMQEALRDKIEALEETDDEECHKQAAKLREDLRVMDDTGTLALRGLIVDDGFFTDDSDEEEEDDDDAAQFNVTSAAYHSLDDPLGLKKQSSENVLNALAASTRS
jgi:hypothetical protein